MVALTDALNMLKGTPYLIDGTSDATVRFGKVLTRSSEVGERARQTNRRVAHQASAALEPFRAALRSELVAESNRIEGYEWTTAQVRQAVRLHRELLNAPVRALLESFRADDRVLEALGLYRAYLIADDWANSGRRPREFEIRQLHGLVMQGLHSAGMYKLAENEIAGALHKPVNPGDVGAAMSDLSSWWDQGSGDPVLDAAVVHAWLTHIHPFDDGNGRMARLLANLALAQAEYPPLLLSADADRGQYLDALAASDTGDILPLYRLFAVVLRRAVRVMSSPSYVEQVIEDRLLSDSWDRHGLWRQTALAFQDDLRRRLRAAGWDLLAQGVPNVDSFVLLEQRDPAGNSWFCRIQDSNGVSRWLLWFGYNSAELVQICGDPSGYPSVFFSVRDENPKAVHPYRPVMTAPPSSRLPVEVVLSPGKLQPALVRHGWDTEDLALAEAAEQITDGLLHDSP